MATAIACAAVSVECTFLAIVGIDDRPTLFVVSVVSLVSAMAMKPRQVGECCGWIVVVIAD
jgi:hypothetical protein